MTLGLQLSLVVMCYLTFVGVTSAAWRFIVPQPPQLHSLDVIRGLCACLVFVVHAIKTQSVFVHGHPYELSGALKEMVPLGDVGVIVFFFITGYLFFGVAYPSSTGVAAALMYLRKRFRRLAPAFFAVAICALLLHLGVSVGHESWAQLLEDAARIFSFGAFRGDLTTRDPLMWNAINMAWTLEFEWVFYFMVAASMMLPGRRLIALCLVLAMAGTQWFLVGHSADGRFYLYFLVGGLVHHLGRRSWALMVVAVAVYLLGGKWSLLSFALFWSAVYVQAVPKVLKPFAIAGNITYSFYLAHGMVLLAVYWGARPWWGAFELESWRLFAFAILAAALASVISLMVYRFTELPYFLRRKR